MTSQVPRFRCFFLLLAAEKKTPKTGQLWRHQGPSYLVTTLPQCKFDLCKLTKKHGSSWCSKIPDKNIYNLHLKLNNCKILLHCRPCGICQLLVLWSQVDRHHYQERWASHAIRPRSPCWFRRNTGNLHSQPALRGIKVCVKVRNVTFYVAQDPSLNDQTYM